MFAADYEAGLRFAIAALLVILTYNVVMWAVRWINAGIDWFLDNRKCWLIWTDRNTLCLYRREDHERFYLNLIKNRPGLSMGRSAEVAYEVVADSLSRALDADCVFSIVSYNEKQAEDTFRQIRDMTAHTPPSLLLEDEATAMVRAGAIPSQVRPKPVIYDWARDLIFAEAAHK